MKAASSKRSDNLVGKHFNQTALSVNAAKLLQSSDSLILATFAMPHINAPQRTNHHSLTAKCACDYITICLVRVVRFIGMPFVVKASHLSTSPLGRVPIYAIH